MPTLCLRSSRETIRRNCLRLRKKRKIKEKTRKARITKVRASKEKIRNSRRRKMIRKKDKITTAVDYAFCFCSKV